MPSVLKRAVMILITAVLGLSSVVSPVCYAAAEESAETQEDAGGQGDGENDKNLLDKGAEIGSDLYDKIDEKDARRGGQQAVKKTGVMEKRFDAAGDILRDIAGGRQKHG